jgi:hypothetical protein
MYRLGVLALALLVIGCASGKPRPAGPDDADLIIHLDVAKLGETTKAPKEMLKELLKPIRRTIWDGLPVQKGNIMMGLDKSGVIFVRLDGYEPFDIFTVAEKLRAESMPYPILVRER